MTQDLPLVHLKPGRARALARRHPWIYSGAIAKVDGDPPTGSTVAVRDEHGQVLAIGAWNGTSNIRVRIWDWHADTRIGADFFAARIRAAIALREQILAPAADAAVRLVNGESDGLPGLVVDRYADVLVLQTTSAGARHWRDAIVSALVAATGARAIYEKSDGDVLALEGLPAQIGLVHGTLPTLEVSCREHGLLLDVDIEHGHKTGHYLDQRDNRLVVGELARGRDVLDCFCYSGGFTLQALAHGATQVTAVDGSAAALARLEHHVTRNALPRDRLETVEDDVFKYLRKLRDQGRQFDLVVLDPPKFAPTAASAERAARGYKDINLLACKLLRPGGVLATFSCSGGVSADLFRKIVAGAALDAEADLKLLRQLHAAPDHPVALSFPEGEYLKGLLARVG